MKLKAKINASQKVEAELIEEGIGAAIAKWLGLGAKTAPKVTDDVAKASAKVAATLTGKAWMALSQLVKSPQAKEKLLKTIEKAESSKVPQLFSHNIATGKQINFYVKPDGKIATKLTDAEQALVKQTGGEIYQKLPSLAAQDAAAVGVKTGAKVGTKDISAAAKMNQAAKAAKPGEKVVAGIVKKSDDVFEAPIVGSAGKVKDTAKLSAKEVGLVNKFRDSLTDINLFFSKSGRVIKNAKEARDAVLKANPKDIKRANAVFRDTLEKGGLSQNEIKRQLRISKNLSDKFDKLGYHPQLAKGVFGNVRATLSSKELSLVSKIMGIPKAVLKDLFGLGKYAVMSVFKTTLKLMALALVGVGLIFGTESLFGIGEPDQGDPDVDLEPYMTHVRFLGDPSAPEVVDKEDLDFSAAIDALYESRSPMTITSKIKIISSDHAILVSEQRSQAELDQERKDFEKKYFSTLPEQFNQLDFLGPAGLAHLFGHVMEDDKLSRLRSAAKESYGEFQEEMAGIYSSVRNWDYLMLGLASLDAATPYFTVIATSLAKIFPNVGVGGITLDLFDSEKFMRDASDAFNKLDYTDWKEFVTPITYQIMLEPGSDTVAGFNEKLEKYAGTKFSDLKKYYKDDDQDQIQKKEEELITQSSGGELSELISQLSTEDVKEFVKAVK